MKNKISPQIILSEDTQSRRFQRFFILSSAISFIVILTLFGTGIYLAFQNYIQREAEKNAVDISQALLGQGHSILIHMGEKAVLRLDDEDFAAFDQEIQRILKALDVAKIKVFDAGKKIIYSNDYGIIGRIDEKNEALQIALSGGIYSELETKGEFWDLEGEKKIDIDVVETYIPITDDQGRIIGAYEIYLDVSPYQKDVLQFVLISLGLISIILAAIFFVIYFLLRKATGIIRSKTQEIKVLSGLLPVCSFCKKIRNEKGSWEAMEEYITARSESVFSHSFCPECIARHYPELNLDESDDR